MNLRYKLEAIRIRKGLSQRKASMEIGISRYCYWSFTNGKHTPFDYNMVKIMKWIGENKQKE